MNILLIGCGNIGGMLLRSWSQTQESNRILVVQPSMRDTDEYESDNITFISNVHDLPATFKADVVVLAVKPQNLHDVLPHIKHLHINRLVSVLAATPISQFTAVFPKTTKVFRLMPNIAMRTNKSINLIVADQEVTAEDAACMETLFAVNGAITWLDTEDELDHLTLIASSGIAYFCLLGEFLAQEACKLGIDSALALKLVQQTISGTASLVEHEHNFEKLIDAVSSKKGVTAAALEVLRPKMQTALAEAIQAALKRREEMQHENRR